MVEDSPLWTVEEAAGYLRVSRSTVYRLARDGGPLVLVHVAGRALVSRASVLAYTAQVVDAATAPTGIPMVGGIGGEPGEWTPGDPEFGP